MLRFRQRALFCVLSLLAIKFAGALDICDVCKCFDYEESNVVIACKSYKNTLPDVDFESVEWPKTEDRTVKAFFNNMSLHLLPKIAGNENVISLNFDDNMMRMLSSNPFEYFTRVNFISLANNRLKEIPKDFLQSISTLEELNLANNSLSTIDPHTFAHLKELNELNLSHNAITKLSAELLEALRNTYVLRLENNKIYSIDNAFANVDYKLRKLYLAFNQFTVITAGMFEQFNNIEMIDLSDNKISNIDESAFAHLDALKLLDLSNNNIKRAAMRLPDSVELLTLANNNLIAWPFLNTPENLSELELQQNSLEYIFPKDAEVRSLKILDVSKNMIYYLPNTQFLQLEHLNLANNLLSSVPQNLNSMTPILRELILDGNQISTIEFNEETTLATISLSHMPVLKTIKAGAFSNLHGTLLTFDRSEHCVEVKISHNEYLSEIEEGAFEGLRMCHLDLSYNNLTKIPQNLTDWTKIENGLDLQGNPFSCYCDDQWMLSSILNTLYYNENHQYLLMELRCEYPEERQGDRFVKFLNHKDPFCSSSDSDEKMGKIVQESSFGGFFNSHDESHAKFTLKPFNAGFIIIVSLSALILILLIVVAFKWHREQRLKLARRNRLYYDEY